MHEIEVPILVNWIFLTINQTLSEYILFINIASTFKIWKATYYSF